MVVEDDDLHVWYSFSLSLWKASGREGDYGIRERLHDAVDVAIDASQTAHHAKRRIVVHAKHRGTVTRRFTPTDGPGSSQLFQDSVP